MSPSFPVRAGMSLRGALTGVYYCWVSLLYSLLKTSLPLARIYSPSCVLVSMSGSCPRLVLSSWSDVVYVWFTFPVDYSAYSQELTVEYLVDIFGPIASIV